MNVRNKTYRLSIAIEMHIHIVKWTTVLICKHTIIYRSEELRCKPLLPLKNTIPTYMDQK